MVLSSIFEETSRLRRSSCRIQWQVSVRPGVREPVAADPPAAPGSGMPTGDGRGARSLMPHAAASVIVPPAEYRAPDGAEQLEDHPDHYQDDAKGP